MTSSLPSYIEPELTTAVSLCRPDGRLNREAVGWSRNPVYACNLPPTLRRTKKWNYWGITSERLFFSATIADMERLQLGGAYLVDRRTHLHLDKSVTRAPGTIIIPEGVAGDMIIEHPEMSVALTDEGTGTRIRVEASDFGGELLRADLRIQRPPGHETLNVVIPWSDDEFQFTSKQNTLPATGFVQLGEERYEFSAPAFGCLDFGRGIWPEHSVWNWGSASGIQEGHTIGLNLGAKWTDGTGMNENGLCIDGRLTKLSEDLLIDYDRGAWMKPWHVRTSATDRIDLTFVPEYERFAKSGRRDNFFTEAHQMFGSYSGRVVPDTGESLEVRDLWGWIEEHEARW